MSTATETEYKFFQGGKSKALKGLKRHLKERASLFTDEELGKLMFQHGENAQWGFCIGDVDMEADRKANPPAQTSEAPAPDDTSATEEHPSTDEQEHDNTGDEEAAAPAAGAFAHLGFSLQNHQQQQPTPPAPTRQASRNTYTIEKNRPEQNGIKRPSIGGKCRAVWDAMDELRANANAIPTSEQVRKLAEDRGWNKNNTMIEFYQWRKFNGITGRANKE